MPSASAASRLPTVVRHTELGNGSTFRVRIPAGPVRDASNATRLESQIGEPLDKVRLRNRRVPAVDDREEICYLVSRYVRDAGGRVDVAGDGEAAIEAVEAAAATDPFDAMILDIHMPG